jgi:hypothetical protein
MNRWQATFLGLKQLPRELSGFEIEAFFTFTATAKMQAIFDRWAQRRSGAVPLELIGRIALTRNEGLNMRGIFSFPIEQYAEALLPSWATRKIQILGR